MKWDDLGALPPLRKTSNCGMTACSVKGGMTLFLSNILNLNIYKTLLLLGLFTLIMQCAKNVAGETI